MKFYRFLILMFRYTYEFGTMIVGLILSVIVLPPVILAALCAEDPAAYLMGLQDRFDKIFNFLEKRE